jgi:hypothetical protein
LADGCAPQAMDRASPYARRREPSTPEPSPATRLANPRRPVPQGWEHWVKWARQPDNWLALRSLLPPIMLGMMPRKPPRDPDEAWCVLYEMLWLRATGATMLVPAVRDGVPVGAYAAPVEHDSTAVFPDGSARTVRVCTRAAPVLKLERSRWEGWRFEPEILRQSFSEGPEGEEGERSDDRAAGHLGGDLSWDGVEPATRRKPDKPGERDGLTEVGGASLEVESVTEIDWLTCIELEGPPTTWAGFLIREVKRAKARILDYEREGGKRPRGVSPADVLRSARKEGADVPRWVTPQIVRYLLAVTSWQSGGNWQCSADTMEAALKSPKRFARRALKQLENVAVLHFDPTPGADNQHACDTLQRAHELADAVLGQSRKPGIAFRVRLLKLQNTSDPVRLEARDDLIKLYIVAIEDERP